MLPTLPALSMIIYNPVWVRLYGNSAVPIHLFQPNSNAQDAIQLTDSQLERLAVARAQFIRRWG